MESSLYVENEQIDAIRKETKNVYDNIEDGYQDLAYQKRITN